MGVKRWLCLLAATLSVAVSQERWVLRFTPPVGLTLEWRIRMTARRLADGQTQTETTELTVRERVEAVHPDGKIVWSSQIVRGIVDGEPLPLSALERTVAEITPLGLPARPTDLPPPTSDSVDDWLTELMGGIVLAFPQEPVTRGQSWTRKIVVRLKPPNEPRSLTVTYRLEGTETVKGTECLRITVQARTPVRLLWRHRNGSITVTGGTRVEGTYWFDPALGIVRQRRIVLTIGYTRESEVWDGFQFVQTAQFVNQTTEVIAELLTP
jgi:hypothetical protein